jgi:cytochrome P450
MAFKEALRLMPPVPSIPRRALREFEFKGFRHNHCSRPFALVRH